MAIPDAAPQQWLTSCHWNVIIKSPLSNYRLGTLQLVLLQCLQAKYFMSPALSLGTGTHHPCLMVVCCFVMSAVCSRMKWVHPFWPVAKKKKKKRLVQQALIFSIALRRAPFVCCLELFGSSILHYSPISMLSSKLPTSLIPVLHLCRCWLETALIYNNGFLAALLFSRWIKCIDCIQKGANVLFRKSLLAVLSAFIRSADLQFKRPSALCDNDGTLFLVSWQKDEKKCRFFFLRLLLSGCS